MQRMKGQANSQANNGPKEHQQHQQQQQQGDHIGGGEDSGYDSWRGGNNAQHHSSYPISTGDPYSPYYAGTSFPYQTFGAGDGTWSNGTDPVAFLSGYGGQMSHDGYSMDGMFSASTSGSFGTAFGQPPFNYFPGNGDFSAWSTSRKPRYEEYYPQQQRNDNYQSNPSGDMKTIEQNVQGLNIGGAQTAASSGITGGNGNITDDIHDITRHDRIPSLPKPEVKEPRKITWASVASQPAKPVPPISATQGMKKKAGMPPPPIVPGKHNMDIGTWGEGKSSIPPPKAPPPPSPAQIQPPAPPPLPAVQRQRPPPPPSWTRHPGASTPQIPPQQQPQQQHQQQQTHSQHAQAPPTSGQLAHQQTHPAQQQHHQHPAQASHHQHQPQHHHQQSQQQLQTQAQAQAHQQQQQLHQQHSQQSIHQPQMQQNSPPSMSHHHHHHHHHQQQHQQPQQQQQQLSPTGQQQSLPGQQAIANPILDVLKVKNDYNPLDFDQTAPGARFFVIKSYSEDDIHRSIKYEIWCSTEHGNKRLDQAYRDSNRDGSPLYLFFSVNGSGHFCGMAQMVSSVDYHSNSSVWSQDKWKGQFRVRWIYVKDVPNTQLRHITLENNENKPVTNSRDTQEVPHAKGIKVLKVLHSYRHSTSIFDDFGHYEKRQAEEDERKVPPSNMMIQHRQPQHQYHSQQQQPHHQQQQHHHHHSQQQQQQHHQHHHQQQQHQQQDHQVHRNRGRASRADVRDHPQRPPQEHQHPRHLQDHPHPRHHPQDHQHPQDHREQHSQQEQHQQRKAWPTSRSAKERIAPRYASDADATHHRRDNKSE